MRRKERGGSASQSPAGANEARKDSLPPPNSKASTWYNEPLPVGILVLIGTCLFQFFGWRYQQQFIAEQSRAATAAALAQATIDDATKAVGSDLTAAAGYVAAHKTEMTDIQLRATIDDYNRLKRDWELGEDLLKARMRRWFPAPHIVASWNGVLERLDDLNAAVNDLIKFNTEDSTTTHRQQIERCEAIIEDTGQRLGELNRLMTDQLTASLPP